MIRKIKGLVLAMMAVGALAALAAPAVQAAGKITVEGAGAGTETTFQALPDEAGGTKTAHHVFDIKDLVNGVLVERSITCNELTGDAVVKGPEITEAVITPHYGKTVSGVFKTECNFAGQETSVTSGACQYRITTEEIHVENDPGVSGECKHEVEGKTFNPIVFENTALHCKVEVGAQTVKGIKFHQGPELTLGTPAKKVKTVTLEANNLEKIVYNATGEGCPFGTTTNGVYTTGNTIIAGSKKGTTEFVNLTWDAT